MMSAKHLKVEKLDFFWTNYPCRTVAPASIANKFTRKIFTYVTCMKDANRAEENSAN